MNTEQINITLGVSLILGDVTNLLLYTKKKGPDGKDYYVDRELPFRLRYRLNKNRLLFEKDSKEFQKQRLFALAKYGEATPEGDNVTINDPQKQELFRQEIARILDIPVSHNIIGIEPEDLDLVKDTDIEISPDAMALFIGYMTNDPELQKDLSTQINLNIVTPPAEKKTEPQQEAEVKKEKSAEAPAPKKTRKTTVKKEGQTEGETPKKTRKPRAKKTEE